MTPQEKAKELFEKYKIFVLCQFPRGGYDAHVEKENAKKCAKIAVEEIIKNSFENYKYWNEVLTKIDSI